MFPTFPQCGLPPTALILLALSGLQANIVRGLRAKSFCRTRVQIDFTQTDSRKRFAN
jgi:hypothetical protein